MLIPAKEQMLENWLMEMANIGYGRTKLQLPVSQGNSAKGGKAKSNICMPLSVKLGHGDTMYINSQWEQTDHRETVRETETVD